MYTTKSKWSFQFQIKQASQKFKSKHHFVVINIWNIVILKDVAV